MLSQGTVIRPTLAAFGGFELKAVMIKLLRNLSHVFFIILYQVKRKGIIHTVEIELFRECLVCYESFRLKHFCAK